MRPIVIGDLGTLMGTKEKPSKVLWLRERGIDVQGVQIIQLASDLMPRALATYGEKLIQILQAVSGLSRVSVALLCWPLLKTNDEAGKTVDVAASTFLNADLYYPTLTVARALQHVHDETGIDVDMSYHPMLTWPTVAMEDVPDKLWLQSFLWECELTHRAEFMKLLNKFRVFDVRIGTENEPTTSDAWANLTHTGNRLFTEQIHRLPAAWGVTADLQHLYMALTCLRKGLPILPALPVDEHPLTLEGQFAALNAVHGPITFHVAQMDDPMRHITPPIRWDDPIMDWPEILRQMKILKERRKGDVWYAVEIDGGHKYPDGYERDFAGFRHLQDYFGS